jgi:hypothetical protein
MKNLKDVELVSSGIYLPGNPIPFEKIEDYLGYLEGAPLKIKKLIDKLKTRVKDQIGIE